MTNQNEDERQQNELELQTEEIKDLDVAEPVLDEVRGGNSFGASAPVTASR
jgi:hypothetical protein